MRLTEFSITEEAFDPALNPIRAKVSLGMRVLSVDDLGFEHKGGSLFMAYLQQKERLADAAPAAALCDARHHGDPMSANHLPAHQPLRRHRDRDARGCRTAATIVYLRRRFVPPPERFALLQEHTVTQGDGSTTSPRTYLGDPEQFWRVCDANGAMRPDELTETIGRRLRITLPEGIPGTPDA